MRRFMFIFSVLLLGLAATEAYSQSWLEKMGKKAVKRAEKRSKDKVNKPVDKIERMTWYEIGNTASWAGWGIDNLQGMEKSWEKNTNVYPVGKISGPVYVKTIQEVGAYNSISSIFSILPVAATSADPGK